LVLRVEMTFDRDSKAKKSVASVVQTWIKRGGTWRILVTQRSDAVPLHLIQLPEPAIPNTSLLLRSEGCPQRIECRAGGFPNGPEAGAGWFLGQTGAMTATCSTPLFTPRKLAPLVNANYHVVHISIGDDGKSNGDLAARFQVALDKGIPSLAVLDGNERLITSQKNGEFESAAKIGMGDVSGFLNRWKPVAAQ
jgi:hypothetical protein